MKLPEFNKKPKESVAQCEINEDVIKVSKWYIPGMAVGFSSPKLKLHVSDGFEFMKDNQDAFDLIMGWHGGTVVSTAASQY